MKYDLLLNIGYDYAAEVKDARHVLRVRPRAGDGQQVASVSLTSDPDPDEKIRERDFFGNALDHVLILPAHRSLSVTMRARVSVDRLAPDLAATPTVGETMDLAFLDRDSSGAGPMHFLGDSRIVKRSDALTAFGAASLDRNRPIGEAVFDFARLIQKQFAYKPGETTVETSAEEAFVSRKGVCQDFAHVMIAALRGLGVPAAYVSGFLRTEPPPGKPKLAGADAMHAWVNVWLGPSLGWFGFDPTNGMLALEDHMVVATGRDYSDVAPIDGILITEGGQETRHAVDVIPVETEAPAPV